MTHKGYDLEKLGEAMHEALSKTCEAIDQAPYPPWAECVGAKAWMRDCTLNTARFVVDNPRATAPEVWGVWAEDKRKAGWVWGEKKDAVAKTHPLLPKSGETLAEAHARLSWGEQLKDIVALYAVQQAMKEQEAQWAREMERVREVSLPQGPWERMLELRKDTI